MHIAIGNGVDVEALLAPLKDMRAKSAPLLGASSSHWGSPRLLLHSVGFYHGGISRSIKPDACHPNLTMRAESCIIGIMADRGKIDIRIGVIARLRGITTAAELGRRIGVSRDSARKLMSAKSAEDLSRINISTLEGLCNGLNTSPGQLLVYRPPDRWRSAGAQDDPVSSKPTRVPPS